MTRAPWFAICGALLAILLGMLPGNAQDKKKADDKKPAVKKPAEVFTDAKEAGPDYLVQGEYVGTLGKDKLGAQVVAKGSGNFEVYLLSGGLPGAGWDTKGRVKVQAKSESTGQTVLLPAGKWSGAIADGKFSGKDPAGVDFFLQKIERKSPTLLAPPPAGALV